MDDEKLADMFAHVFRRFTNLEQHIINNIVVAQTLESVLKNPLKLNSANFEGKLEGFAKSLKDFLEHFSDPAKTMQSFGELKFIGKRVVELQTSIDEIKKTLEGIVKNGIDKKVMVDVIVNGNEMITKKGLDRATQKEVDPESALRELLSTLTAREIECINHRYGLFGTKKKTLVGIGTILGRSSERIRAILSKGLRKLRHPSNRDLVNRLAPSQFKLDIIGEYE